MPEPWYSYAQIRYQNGAWDETKLTAFVTLNRITEAEKAEIMGGS